MNKIINRYLIINFFRVVTNVILIFVCLGIVLNLFEEIEFFKNQDQHLIPFFLTFLYIPNLIIKLLPFIIFISAMWYLIYIKTNKDLLSLKVFGYSNLKIIFLISLSALLFGIVTLIVFSPLTSSMIKYYEKTKAKYSKDVDHLVSINKNGVWIKEIQGKNFRIITAKGLVKNYLNEVTIYNLDSNSKILNRIETDEVDVSSNTWLLKKAVVYNNDLNENEIKENFTLESRYNFENLSSLYKNLDTISFYELISEYKTLMNKGYNEELLIEQLHRFISLPIFLFLMVVLASVFTIGTLNKPQNLRYVFLSIISCVIIYYFKDLSIALGQTNRISLVTAVWMPIIALTLFCSIGVLQINEK